MDIIVDTREQRALIFKRKGVDTVEYKGLKVGDYSLKGYENKIAIERKSPGDLFGTLGGGHKRFKKELEKSKLLDYFAIVIEGSYSKIINKDFEGSHHTRMRGYVITSILFTLHVKYNINVFFANNRNEAKNIIREIFKAYLKYQEIINRGDKNGKVSGTTPP